MYTWCILVSRSHKKRKASVRVWLRETRCIHCHRYYGAIISMTWCMGVAENLLRKLLKTHVKSNAVPRHDAELDAPWAAYMLVIIPMPPFARS